MRLSCDLLKLAAAIACILATCSLHAQEQQQVRDDIQFQALGGHAGIQNIATELVSIVLLDSRIKQTFKDVDTDRLKAKLAEQFCVLSGGPCKYTGKDMTTIHDGLSITNAQFNALAEDLQIAMEKYQIAAGVQNKLLAKLAPMQREIVTK